ncbi:type II secretion system protein N [Saccharophagus degradans]|uniref:Type II secretion system protein N n=1 Tax=Saccharophagus degradans (strain 2-40 / ATCC 43961 / DSM 17024) TaxID=203122 RepID=Q21EQ4_SACD2|nr:type II secretion system protein N [Saccharophagus degradans]ABD82825.1 type II secretion system protein N [Saccharophagus degradans 2-40]
MANILKKFARLLVILALVAYFLFLVLSRVPAAYAVSAVHNAVPNLWLTGVRGTLWNGQAGASQVDIAGNPIALGKVSWTLSPWSLLVLSPCVEFKASQARQNISGKLCQSAGGTTKLKNVSIDGSVAIVNALLPNGGKASGTGSIEVISAEVTPQSIQKMDARVSWQNARVFADGTWFSLGSYAANVKENGRGGLAADVFDLDAPFQTKLNADWMANQGWKLNGTVKPLSNAPELLVQALPVIGEELEDGAYKIVW